MLSKGEDNFPALFLMEAFRSQPARGVFAKRHPPVRTCADLLMSTSASELPKARLARGATPADVR